MALWIWIIIGACVAAEGIVAFYIAVRRRHLDRWVPTYLRERRKRRAWDDNEPIDVLLCIADHFEPRWADASSRLADARVRDWVENYPRLFGAFRDSDGRPPQHSFFYPLDQYEPNHVESIASLCEQGYGEVEIHLHHDHDSAEVLREKMRWFVAVLSERHNLLARDPQTGAPVYAFIHGNWALDNASPDGLWCGVNNELDVLRETGCYVDMTLPSAPSITQTRKINSIYYAVDDPRRSKSHDWGIDVGAAPQPDNALMLIQGPLLLDWRRRKFKIMPRIENACLQGTQPPDLHRLRLWMRARVSVPKRPQWLFVKLHTHGAPESNRPMLLGAPMVRFHEGLARMAKCDPRFRFHYVTAREMYNLARAAEAGWDGSVEKARDYELPPPPRVNVRTVPAPC